MTKTKRNEPLPRALTDEDLRKVSGGVRRGDQLAQQMPGEVSGGDDPGECDRCIPDPPRRKD